MGTVAHILLAVVCIIIGGAAVAVVNLPAVRRRLTAVKPICKRLIDPAMWRGAIGKLSPAAATLSTTLRGALDRIPRLHRKRSDPPTVNLYKPIDMTALNCRVRTDHEITDNAWRSVVLVDLCGTIEASDDNGDVCLEIVLSDAAESQPALVRSQQGVAQAGCPFVYQTDMGRLCHRTTLLDQWTTVARICPDSFVLPRQGQRHLQCEITVLSKAARARLATATGATAYENVETGYLDIEDRIERTKTLAVGLAFSVGAADNSLLDSEVEVIHAWVKTNFDSAHASSSACSQLQRALRKTAAFFRHGGKLNVERICREIMEIAPMVGRLDTLDLCLRVAAARGQVGEARMALVKQLADLLGVERARLRVMAEKILPINMHQVHDSEIVLGVTTDMSKDEARQQLNHEYAKWSSRVISSDPAIQKQADQMLQLIADARAQYVGVNPARK